MKESNEVRYARASEIIQILQALWRTDGPFEWKGEFYKHQPADHRTRQTLSQQNGGPLMYFGGISPAAQDLCAKHCDVFLMWPETEDRISETMRGMSEKAAMDVRSTLASVVTSLSVKRNPRLALRRTG